MHNAARTCLVTSWKILFYAALIVASVLLAPESQVRFIYTEF